MKWSLPETYPTLYKAFLYYFNIERDYYECHEVLEELWLAEGRHPLYQGLLQVAVALYHFSNGNVNGARKLFRGGLEKLAPFPDDCMGIDLGKLKREAQQYLEKLQAYETKPFAFYDLTIDIKDRELRERIASGGDV